MKKLAVLSTLILAALGSSVAAQTSTATSPVIVAKRSLLNKTQSIPLTTIFTPSRSGLFRISAYGMPTVTDGGSVVNISFSYSDEVGPAFQMFSFLANHTGCNQEITEGFNCSYSAVIEAKAGVPIQYSTGVCEGCAVTYDIFFTVERLQ